MIFNTVGQAIGTSHLHTRCETSSFDWLGLKDSDQSNEAIGTSHIHTRCEASSFDWLGLKDSDKPNDNSQHIVRRQID